MTTDPTTIELARIQREREPTGCIVFAKNGTEYAFLIGDDCWDADDPRSEMIEELIAEIERLRARVALLEESLDATCETCDGACPHRKDQP